LGNNPTAGLEARQQPERSLVDASASANSASSASEEDVEFLIAIHAEITRTEGVKQRDKPSSTLTRRIIGQITPADTCATRDRRLRRLGEQHAASATANRAAPPAADAAKRLSGRHY